MIPSAALAVISEPGCLLRVRCCVSFLYDMRSARIPNWPCVFMLCAVQTRLIPLVAVYCLLFDVLMLLFDAFVLIPYWEEGCFLPAGRGVPSTQIGPNRRLRWLHGDSVLIAPCIHGTAS
ncbi:hypothetical protein ASPFODRAFT_256356 [Aspergillus luchuensis CBS 106.47]|uniref:Uncharacterized protein n=1 Tax=Aspergillus luchuensis (strain CBS 106.47) TaxID=1137211 RepID=A0A1M3TZU5_ASPLC|nr:hypothetical protein ASPFODRAFT_256356 [Aspergillus luchuensis CBS 106.47]